MKKISIDKKGLEKRQKSSGGKIFQEGVHDATISEIEKRTSEAGSEFFLVKFVNGERKTSLLVFPPDGTRAYDPSNFRNKMTEAFFTHTLGIDLDINSDNYIDNLSEAYDLLEHGNLKGLHTRFKVAYTGLHAKYHKEDKVFYTLSTRNGEVLRGYEGKKFESGAAVKAEIARINQSKPKDKQLRFCQFPEIVEFLEPKVSNEGLLAKVRKAEEGEDLSDEESF